MIYLTAVVALFLFVYLFAVVMFVGTIVWAIYFDTLKPNPGLTAHPTARSYEIASATASGGKLPISLPAVAGLPVDQHLGNLEGKELRFGTSAGATFAAITVDVTCGAVNAEHDSLTPMASVSPMVGMWLNCIFGGKGVGMINLLLFLVIGVFIAGQMVGRTPEYLGRKLGGREMKLAMLALLVHPIMILMPTGLFTATNWGLKATRGALTTFSISNDVAKYFAIIPALFAGTLPWLKTMDIMHLHSPTSAILSAVIFNALIIPLLIPIALKGVKYQPLGADALLRRNL